jgi:hypothetical protein
MSLNDDPGPLPTVTMTISDPTDAGGALSEFQGGTKIAVQGVATWTPGDAYYVTGARVFLIQPLTVSGNPVEVELGRAEAEVTGQTDDDTTGGQGASLSWRARLEVPGGRIGQAIVRAVAHDYQGNPLAQHDVNVLLIS